MPPTYPLQRISSPNTQAFFGYYDVAATNLGGRHLAHHPAFIDRLPQATDPVVLGWYDDPSDNEPAHFTPIAESRAWNFQQGSQLQWIGPQRDRLIWNDASVSGELFSIIGDRNGLCLKTLPLPVANVSRDASTALSFNFERLMDYRPGYGYPNRQDPFYTDSAPAEDGLFIIDIATGTSKLALSLQQSYQLMRSSGLPSPAKVLINHATLNPSATHFIALARPFRSGDLPIATTVIHAAVDGSEAKVLLPYGMASHYYWINDQELLFWCDGPAGAGLYRVHSGEGTLHPIDPTRFNEDIHMSLDKTGQWMLYDTYPDPNRQQHLSIYHLASGTHHALGSFYSLPSDPGDLRCDLHPRWNPDGTSFTFDSTHEGYRAIYSMDLSAVLPSV